MSTVLTGQSIGRAHYAIRALLEQKLTAIGHTFETWIPLNAVGTNGPTAEADLTEFVVTGLKISPQRARSAIAQLLESGLLQGEEILSTTEAGQKLWEQVSAEVRPITSYLFEGFTEEEKAITAMLLAQVTERANKAL